MLTRTLLCLSLLVAAGALASTTADTIFRGGTIVTVDRAHPEARALAVANGVIIAVGDEAAVMKTRGPKTQVIDLRGGTLMPGFVEPHTHVIGTAFDTHILLNLSSFTVPMKPGTIPEIVTALKAALPGVPQNGWLTAFGVDPSRTPPFMASLDADQLDEVSTTVPIFVLNQSGHIAYVNHKAFAEAGITDQTPNPPGGVYVKKNGK